MNRNFYNPHVYSLLTEGRTLGWRQLYWRAHQRIVREVPNDDVTAALVLLLSDGNRSRLKIPRPLGVLYRKAVRIPGEMRSQWVARIVESFPVYLAYQAIWKEIFIDEDNFLTASQKDEALNSLIESTRLMRETLT